ncbi:hypothetical protein [Streptomyces sp. NPDC002845]
MPTRPDPIRAASRRLQPVNEITVNWNPASAGTRLRLELGSGLDERIRSRPVWPVDRDG